MQAIRAWIADVNFRITDNIESVNFADISILCFISLWVAIFHKFRS